MSGMAAANTENKRYDLDNVVRLLMSVATLIAVVWLLRYLSDVLIPFVVALLIAYLLNPTVVFVEKRVKHRSIAVLLTVFGCLGLMMSAVVVSVPIVAAELSDFRGVLSELRESAAREAGVSLDAATDGSKTDLTLGERFDLLIDTQANENIRSALQQVRDFVTSEEFDLEKYVLEGAKRLVPGVWGVVTGALSFLLGLTGLVVILLYVVFLLNDFGLVERAWKDQLPPSYREPVVQFLTEFQFAMSRYFRGQFVVAACVGVLFAVGFGLIGLRLGVALGLFVGLLNMVPYLQTIGLIPASMLAVLRALENDTSVWTSLLLTASVFVVAQVIQDAVLTPRIIGKTTGLRPAVILLGVFVWGKVLGFLGLVLAIPLTCLGLAYYRRWVLKLKNVQVIREPNPE